MEVYLSVHMGREVIYYKYMYIINCCNNLLKTLQLKALIFIQYLFFNNCLLNQKFHNLFVPR